MKVITAAICLMALTLGSKAQNQQTEKNQHQRRLMDSLNLSAEQKAKMKAIRDEEKKKTAELQKEMKAKREAVLTTEQKNKIENIKSAGAKEREDQFNKKLEQTKKDLSLTDEQVSRIKNTHRQTMEKIKSVNDDPNLNDQAKKDKIEAIKEQAKEERKAILTEEQKKKMKELKKPLQR